MQGIVNWLFALAASWPDALAVIIGWGAGMGLATGVEYFIPATLPEKLQKGYVWLSVVIGATIVGAIAWRYLDPTDPAVLRITVTLGLSWLAGAIYPAVARLVTKYVPAVASVYAKG